MSNYGACGNGAYLTQNFYYHEVDKIAMNEYSSLPNRCVAQNKHGGEKDEPFLISMVPGISILVRIFRPVTVIKRRKR